MDLRLDRIEQIVHEKYGQPEEPTDQIQNQSEPSAPYQQIEFNPHGQDETGNEDEAVDTGSDASSLVTDATNDHTEPNHSDQHEIVTAKVNGVEKERPTQPVKGGQDVSGMGQQETSYLHHAAQSQSPHQQSPSRPPSTPHPAKQQDQQHQLQTSQQQEQLQQLVEQPQQREVGHELDEIINLASGLTNNHHATIKRPVAIKRPAALKPPAASRAFAMRPISWEAGRRTKISPDLEDFDLNLIDQGGLPWLP